MEVWGWALERAGENSQRQDTEVIRPALEKQDQVRGIIWGKVSEKNGALESCMLLIVPCYSIFHCLKSPLQGADVFFNPVSLLVYILLTLPYLQQRHSLLL